MLTVKTMSFQIARKGVRILPLLFLLYACGGPDLGDDGYHLSSHLRPPSQIDATAGNMKVSLAWERPTLAESFVVYFGTSEELLELQGVEGESLTVEDLTNEVTYFFAIASVNAEGEISSRSELVSTTPTAQQSETEPPAVEV